MKFFISQKFTKCRLIISEISIKDKPNMEIKKNKENIVEIKKDSPFSNILSLLVVSLIFNAM